MNNGRSSNSSKLETESFPGNRSCSLQHASGPIDLEIVDDVTGLVALQEDWDDLFAQCGQANRHFQSYLWNRHWCTYFLNNRPGDARKLAIVTARRHGRLILLCPFAEYRHAGLIHLSWMGAPVSQYGDVLVSPDIAAQDALRAGLKFVVEAVRADLIDLRKVRRDAAIAPALIETGAYATSETEAPYMDLGTARDTEDYVRRYSSQSRKQHRRRRRRLNEQGELRFVCLEPGAQAARHSAIAVRQKRDSLVRNNTVCPALCDDRFERFFEVFANEAKDTTTCLVSLLYCGENVIAREIGLACGTSYCAHVGVYDHRYARFSPGVLQIQDTISECFARRFTTYDLLAPSDEYKLALADASVNVCDYVWPITWRGAIYVNTVLRIARPAMKFGKDYAPYKLGTSVARLMSRLSAVRQNRSSAPAHK